MAPLPNWMPKARNALSKNPSKPYKASSDTSTTVKSNP